MRPVVADKRCVEWKRNNEAIKMGVDTHQLVRTHCTILLAQGSMARGVGKSVFFPSPTVNTPYS